MQVQSLFPEMSAGQNPIEKRREQRFPFEVHAILHLPSGALTPARTLDISESGFGAIVIEEIGVRERVELTMRASDAYVRIEAIVRNRTSFRYGFQFEHADPRIKKVVAGLACEPQLR